MTRAVNNFSLRGAAEITPSDSANLARPTSAIMVTVAGNIAVDFVDVGTVTITGLLVGVRYDFAVKKVYSTATTATGIIGFYS